MEENKKISYEELEKLAKQLSERCSFLEQHIGKIQLDNIFKRLDYLFKVAENSRIFSPEFISKVVLEIEELLTIENSEETKE